MTIPSEALVAEGMRLAASKALVSLAEQPMFAVRMEDGRIGYCIADHDPEDPMDTPCLSLYMEGEGILSYFRMRRAEWNDSAVQFFQAVAREEYLSCTLAPAGAEAGTPPVFRQKQRFYAENALMDAQADGYLRQALRAAAYAAGRLSLADWDIQEDIIPLLTFTPMGQTKYQISSTDYPDDMKVAMSGLVLDDEDLIAHLQSKRMSKGADMYCELVALPREEEDVHGARFYPVGLLATIPSRKWLMLPVVDHVEEGAEALLSYLMDALVDNGLPARVHMRDDITSMYLRLLWDQLGVPVVENEDIQLLDDAIKVFYDRDIKQSK